MRLRFAIVLALILLLLAAFVVVQQGGCDRDPPDEPVPACEPGDSDCKVDAPVDPPMPPVAGKSEAGT